MSTPTIPSPYIPASLLGQPGGVAPLGSRGVIPKEYLPESASAPESTPTAVGGEEIL